MKAAKLANVSWDFSFKLCNQSKKGLKSTLKLLRWVWGLLLPSDRNYTSFHFHFWKLHSALFQEIYSVYSSIFIPEGVQRLCSNSGFTGVVTNKSIPKYPVVVCNFMTVGSILGLSTQKHKCQPVIMLEKRKNVILYRHLWCPVSES